MRKLLISLFTSLILLVLSASSVFAGGVIKLGIELPGSFQTIERYEEVENSPGLSLILDTKMGYSVAGEFFFNLGEKLAVGAGAEYQLNRKTEQHHTPYGWYYEEEFSWIPIYALARCQIDSTFYVTGKVGYNLLHLEDYPESVEFKGGLFYGFGGGVVLSDVFQVEAIYSTNNGKAVEGDSEVGIKYSKLGVSIGCKF